MVQDAMEFGLTINGAHYPIPRPLKQYFQDGWSISDQTPYFLRPMVGEDYYKIRTNWSLTKDGNVIYLGGSIIRLLEKDGVFLEVTIANQAEPGRGEGSQKIEDGVVDSITVFYDEAHTSIRLNGMELSDLTPEALFAAYPGRDGWTHATSDYRDHPELGVSTDWHISGNFNSCKRSINVYFDLENTAAKITVLSQASPRVL